MTYTVAADILMQFGTSVLTASGVPTADAHLLSDSLVTAELWGHSSHGMLRLPWYVERLRNGVMAAVTQSETVVDSGAVVVLDGHHGIGQVLTAEAVELGRRARPQSTASARSASATPTTSAPRPSSPAGRPRPAAWHSCPPTPARRWRPGAAGRRPWAPTLGRSRPPPVVTVSP